jgi:hypothetical protein
MYQFPVDQCDVPLDRQRRLERFRTERQKWLDRLNGTHANAVSNQLRTLMYVDTAYAALKAAHELEAYRPINEMLFLLSEHGYASLIATGVRRLVDKDEKTGSLMNLALSIESAERNGSLFTRENYVCNDGLPFDYRAVITQFHRDNSTNPDNFLRLPSSGPRAWMSSELAHKAFDRPSAHTVGADRKRGDRISPEVFERLRTALASEPIRKLCAYVDTQVAHADHSKDLSAPHLNASLTDVADAYKVLVGVRNFLSAILLGGPFFANAVAVLQYDISAALDEPFVGTNRLPEVGKIWYDESEKRNQWTKAAELDGYYPNAPASS